MLIKRVWICLSITLACQFGCSRQRSSEVKMYGTNDVQEIVLKAAEQGNSSAQSEIGRRYFKATPPDYSNAVKWSRKAADQGDARGQNILGVCYRFGNGVGTDASEAAKYFRKAADQGFAESQFYLGACYYFGKGIRKDAAEATKWFLKAAEQGYADAQVWIGLSYKDGKEVAVNKTEAFKWLRKAAEQGFAEGQFYLGACYLAGEGVTQYKAEAVRWFQKAARQGHENAQELCRRYGVDWNVSSADEIKNVDEKMLAELKAKAESAKSGTLVFKNLYLGMPIQDAAALLRFYMSNGSTEKTPDILLENFSDGRWFREEENGIRVTSRADGKVTAFYFPRKAVEKLFDSKDIEVKAFIQTFQKAYSLPNFSFQSLPLEWFSKNEIEGKTQGIQPIAHELGFQEKWIATTDSGVSVSVYGAPLLFDKQQFTELVMADACEAIPKGSLLIRKINKSAFD